MALILVIAPDKSYVEATFDPREGEQQHARFYLMLGIRSHTFRRGIIGWLQSLDMSDARRASILFNDAWEAAMKEYEKIERPALMS